MPKYHALFKGRPVGAIGVFSWHGRTVRGHNPDDARANLYDTHEHISDLKLSPIVPVADVAPGSNVQTLDQVGKPGNVYQIVGPSDEDSSILATTLHGNTVKLAADAECYVIG